MINHQPVLLKEVIEYLQPRANQNFIDCTVGLAGHAEVILTKTSPNGKLIGFDLDSMAITEAKKRLIKFKNRILLIKINYKNLKRIFYETRFFNQCHGLLLDLGLSSAQLADQKRGFSFKSQSEVLMNFGDDYQILAKDILQNFSEEKLIKIFKEEGNERFAAVIAQKIIQYRKQSRLARQKFTAKKLADLILQVYQNKLKPKIHPATKVFQALRITVNDELNNLKTVLPQAIDILNKEGRLVVISFHSLEDRIVKNFFQQEAKGCLCPPVIPVCRCGHQPRLKIITKKPIVPTGEEISKNPRSRSAKLRVAEKI